MKPTKTIEMMESNSCMNLKVQHIRFGDIVKVAAEHPTPHPPLPDMNEKLGKPSVVLKTQRCLIPDVNTK